MKETRTDWKDQFRIVEGSRYTFPSEVRISWKALKELVEQQFEAGQKSMGKERLTGAIIILYKLWDNSYYSMGKAGSDRIKDEFVELLGKDWSAKIGNFFRDERGYLKQIESLSLTKDSK